MKPVLLLIAGPNGAGKKTVTIRLRAEQWSDGTEYINPDDVAQERFGGWNSPEAVLKAAEWAQARRDLRSANQRCSSRQSGHSGRAHRAHR